MKLSYLLVLHSSHSSHGSHSSHVNTSTQGYSKPWPSGVSWDNQSAGKLQASKYNNIIRNLNRIKSQINGGSVSGSASGKATAAQRNTASLQIKKTYSTYGNNWDGKNSTTYGTFWTGLAEGGTDWLDIPAGVSAGTKINDNLPYTTFVSRINSAVSSGIGYHTNHSNHGSHSSHGSHGDHSSHDSHSSHTDHNSHDSSMYQDYYDT